MKSKEEIRYDLIDEILNETKKIGNIIVSSSDREDELNDKEFGILLKKQTELIK